MKKHNFTAGPCILDEGVIKEAARAVLNYNGTDLSVIEISHRSKTFQDTLAETTALFKEVLEIPDTHTVFFLGGGASLQFYAHAVNFLKKKAAYVDTGNWAHKAIEEAKVVGDVDVIASSRDDNYTFYPELPKLSPDEYDYLHFTTNNTIYGTELREDPEVGVPLIADMSSDIFTRHIDFSKYLCIYGGAQKNIAPAGVTFVIVRKDALGKTGRAIPKILDYQTHVDHPDSYNTPPVFQIYVMQQTLKWFKEIGGLDELEKRAKERAKVLYDEIDRSKVFRGVARKEDRSLMNVDFVLADEYKDKESEFFDFAKKRGMEGIKGHRSIGGCRCSLYNALPLYSVEALVKCMQDFEKEIL